MSEKQKRMAKTLIKMAKTYGYDIDDDQLDAWLQILEQVDEGLFNKSVLAYMSNLKNTRFPVPPHTMLQAVLPPEADEKDVAVTLVRDIIRAIKSHQDGWLTGYVSANGNFWLYKGNRYTTWREAALLELGELGVAVVERFGWAQLCTYYWESDEQIFSAQVREYIASVQRMAKQGLLDQKPALPQAQDVFAKLATATALAELAGDTVQKLESKNKPPQGGKT